MADMYHSCRWCHHHSGGKCSKMSKILSAGDVSPIEALVEEGKLAEAIKESFTQPDITRARRLLANYLSGTRFKEVLEALETDLTIHREELVGEISYSVELAISGSEPSLNDLEIREPEDFYCKYFE